jgi:hypothetical protein
MPYSSLDADKIIATATALEARVADRFPDAGLRGVAAEIVSLSHRTAAEARVLAPPILWLRGLIGAVILAGGAVFVSVGSLLSLHEISQGAIDSVQSIEAAINTLILAGLGLLTLVRLESRIKGQRVARGLHRLRSVIHVIDMHQLTKDPATFASGYTATATSPARPWTEAELERYLDYCAEMLSLTGKLAALYAQAVNDDGVAAAVNDIETLGSNLARKIWQKIVLIESRPRPSILP